MADDRWLMADFQKETKQKKLEKTGLTF